MGKRFFLFIFIAGLLLFGLYWLIYPKSDQLKDDLGEVVRVETQSPDSSSATINIQEKTQIPSKVEMGQEVQQSVPPVTKALEEWEQLKKEADARNKICETAVKNLLPNDDLIDPEDKFFKNREQVMQKLADIFSQTLYRPEAAQGYGQLQNLVVNNFIKDPSEAYQGLTFFDSICRSFKSLNYVDTVLEVGSLNKWTHQEKVEASIFILDQVSILISDHYSPSNMGYVVSLFEGMIERNFLSKDYREELHDFVQKVIDQEEIFLKGFDEQDEESDQSNMAALRAYLEDNQSLGKELNDIISRIRTDFRSN